MKSKVILTCGVPAAGKTTWAENFIKNKTDSYVIETDAIRKELTGSYEDQTQNKEVFKIAHARLGEALRDNIEYIVFDATNLKVWSRDAIIEIAKKYKAEVHCVYFSVPLATCFKRNDERERHVPDHVIVHMFSTMETPTIEEGFDSIKVIKNYE